jgi:hypothetical protein
LGAWFKTRGLRRIGGDSGDQAVNCFSEYSFEPEGGETKTMKKLTLITAALALLGGASIVSAANQNAKSAKIKSTQTASSQTECCGGCCRKANGH